MRKPLFNFQFSPVSIAGGAVGVLSLAYVALIAVVISYATLTIEFSQSVRNEEASIANLEGIYLDTVSRITATDYAAAGDVRPTVKTFVRAKSVTAVR